MIDIQKLREVAQKVNAQRENLVSQIREKDIEIEACKKEIEMERVEKDHLARRVSEVCKTFDLTLIGNYSSLPILMCNMF